MIINQLCYTWVMLFTGFVTTLAIIYALFLTVLSLLRHGAVDFHSFSEKITLTSQSVTSVVVGAVLLLGLSLLLQSILASKSETEKKHIYHLTGALSFALILILGVVLVKLNPYPPIADPLAVWNSAEMVASGNVHGEAFESSALYLNVYPFQKGLVLLCAGLFRLFGTRALTAFYVLNILCSALIVFFLSRIARNLARDSVAGILVHLCGIFFLPLVLYDVFVYGTLLSYVCLLAGFDAVLVLRNILPSLPLKGKARWRYLYFFPAVILPAVSCQLYTSAWIGVIAVTLFFLVSAFLQYARKLRGIVPLCLCALAVLLCALSLQAAVPLVFQKYTGIENSSGTPGSTYLYMGISSTDGLAGPGSHNGSDIGLYSENDLDAQKTDEVAKALIREVADEYASGERSLSFFVEKAWYQWTDPWFSSVQLTVHPGLANVEISSAFQRVFQPGVLSPAQRFLSVYLALVYCGALCGMFLMIKKREVSFSSLLLLLYFVGGFTFQFFWEAKARYCMPYFLILFPFAATAFSFAGRWVAAWLHRR